MPSSGELRLRTLILALIALGGIWIGLVIQRSHGTPPTAVAFAAGPRPADLPASKLVHVAGLSRPAAVTPVGSVTPRVRARLHGCRRDRPQTSGWSSPHEGQRLNLHRRRPSRSPRTTAPPRKVPLRPSSHSRSATCRSSTSPRPARASPGRPMFRRRRRPPSASTRRPSGRSRAARDSSTIRASSPAWNSRRPIRCICTPSTSGTAPRPQPRR